MSPFRSFFRCETAENCGRFAPTRGKRLLVGRFRQRGVAVIMVMLIVAMATTLAVYLAQQQSLWQRQVEAQFDRAQARRLGIAGIDWSRAVLADDAQLNTIDHETEMWTLRLPAMPVENGEVIGLIEDQQGLFNLNNLARNGVSNAVELSKFQRLLTLLGLPQELAFALSDWMDADEISHPMGGAEDDYYLSREFPYRAANRPLAEPGELIRVKGFDSKVIARLEPYISVLPENTALNVNFVSPEVLAAAIPELSLSDARILVQQRRGKPFTDLSDFRRRLPNHILNIDERTFSVSSQYFRVTGRASVNASQVMTQALVQRTQGWPSVVRQNVQ